jgi:hypothetical protein
MSRIQLWSECGGKEVKYLPCWELTWVLAISSTFLSDGAIGVKIWALRFLLLRGCSVHAMTPRHRALPRVR